MTEHAERNEGHEGLPITADMTGPARRGAGTDGPCGANGGKAE
jgi:hypothetical protein